MFMHTTVKNTSQQYARGALIVLSMLASEIPTMVQEHMNALIVHGLGDRGRADPLLAKHACLTLQVWGCEDADLD